MVEFRSKKDKEGKTYTYPIGADKKTKKIKLKKPASKSVRKAKKTINKIKDVLPLSQFIQNSRTNPNSYITNETAYKQSQDAMAMMSKAMKGSKKIREQYDYDKMIDELYKEFNA